MVILSLISILKSYICISKQLVMRYTLILLVFFIALYSCNTKQTNDGCTDNIEQTTTETDTKEVDTIIIDAQYTFQEAIEDANAPQSIIDQLELIDVTYTSTDNKLHQGQILTNKKIAADIKEIFYIMLQQKFVIERVVPIVAYNWSDSISMANNNTYSFCYRNTSYSLHAKGLAIDINPKFNPLRWKNKDMPNEPFGAKLDTTVNGTLYPNHLIVKEFRKRGFRWGHNFTKYWDDHHFDKK